MKKIVLIAIFSLIAASAGSFAATPRVAAKETKPAVVQKEKKIAHVSTQGLHKMHKVHKKNTNSKRNP